MLQSEVGKFDVELIDYQRLHCLMVQGPQAVNAMASVLSDNNSISKVTTMKRFAVVDANLAAHPVFIARISYSGEDGFEIFADSQAITEIWDLLLKKGKPEICPVSFGALDMMRMEAGLLIFGQDMTGTQTPMELGLNLTVDYSKKHFLGKEALLLRNFRLEKCLVGFQSNEQLSLQLRANLCVAGERIGVITSWGYSQWLDKTIGFAHVSPQYARSGTKLSVLCGDICREVEITNRRFYRNLASVAKK